MFVAPKATIDFETRSANKLKKCGSWKYSLDPATEVLCLVWRLPHWEEMRTGLWHPAFPHLGIEEYCDADELAELFDWIAAGGLVEAHNAWFERGIWTNIMVAKYGWDAIPHRQWRCSAAKAASHALPRNLEDAGAALKLNVQKDMLGSVVMKKMMKPRKARKDEVQAWDNRHNAGICLRCKGKAGKKTGRGKKALWTPCEGCQGTGFLPNFFSDVPPMPLLYHESKELFEQLWDYCRIDVLAEEALSSSIPDLNEQETEFYLMDQAVNEYGFCLDPQAIETALSLLVDEFASLNIELSVLTKGQVTKATQRQRMMEWFSDNGLDLEDTTAATVEAALQEESHPRHVRRALEIMRLLGRSSTAKYERMRDWMCPDNRVRGGLLYHGAATGRWSGQGVQPHNFVKGKIEKDLQGEKWNIDKAWDVLTTHDQEVIEDTFGSVMEPLSQALRGAITATPGRQLYVADFNAIEARVLLWLADAEEHLALFAPGQDIYSSMASEIYGYPCGKETHKEERKLGKVAILGLGYQMGAEKFVDTCMAMAKIEISLELSQQVVEAYRAKFWQVKAMWRAQEDAAILAVLKPFKRVSEGRMVWFVEGNFLYCQLPSGRRLAYPFPSVRKKTLPWGKVVDQLCFKGVNPVTRQWHTQTAYGGLLVENQTQACARDLLAVAMYRCFQSEVYTPVLSVHDEIIAEADLGAGDVHEFERLMAALPKWAKGCPVAAEGWAGVRYRK